MRIIILVLVTIWMAGKAPAADSAWLTSVPEAAARANRENKLVLLDFTGSDWCGWCKKLVAETFSQPEFIDYASKNLVMVEVDFPAHEPQSDDLKAANHALKEKYGVNGFPTIILLKPDGTVLWKQPGYLAGGPSAMIAKVNEFRSGSPSPSAANSSRTTTPVVPIYPTPPARKAGDEPKLSGILYSSRHSTAVLNGKTCEVGDTVDGAHIVKIARDKVTVNWKGETKELTIN